MKLLLAAQRAAYEPSHQIEIGDPEAIGDWGYAPEYTLAMKKVLDLEKPDDFVVGTGHQARVADFAEAVFSAFGLNWKEHVTPRPNLLTKPRRNYNGDSTKLYQKTGYRPTLALPALANRLVSDLKGLS
jgi:GDPmannose 4,6-dehydratase